MGFGTINPSWTLQGLHHRGLCPVSLWKSVHVPYVESRYGTWTCYVSWGFGGFLRFRRVSLCHPVVGHGHFHPSAYLFTTRDIFYSTNIIHTSTCPLAERLHVICSCIFLSLLILTINVEVTVYANGDCDCTLCSGIITRCFNATSTKTQLWIHFGAS